MCQLRCKNCYVIPWMNKTKNWHMSMESVRRFIRATVDSKYHFDTIILSGGEPLLWKNLIPALRLIKKARITDTIRMFTNSIVVNVDNVEWFDTVVKLMDSIRISRYIGNEKSIEIIQQRYKGSKKIAILDKTIFNILPITPVLGSIPAKCVCNYPTLFGDVVDVCGGMRFLKILYNKKFDKSLTVPIEKGYLDVLESRKIERKKYRQDVCAYCKANRIVIHMTETEKNYCLDGEKNEHCND